MPTTLLGKLLPMLLSIYLFSIDAGAADPSSPPTPGTPIQWHRSRTETNPYLSRAYDHLQASRLEAAQTDYEAAWRADPKNAEVLLGLATVARRQHRAADADRYYRQALEADPTNAIALAAVIGAAAMANPPLAESQLKNLLSGQPQSSPLNFALGNLYSRQNRWREAQQAYFNALAMDADNPDYLFNLAISLDHLRQRGPAAQHYRLALEAADRHPPAFDREQARLRLRDLQP